MVWFKTFIGELLKMNKFDLEAIAAKRQSTDTQEQRIKNRERLRKLVKRYGHDVVAAATGWKVSTISQYLRNSSPLINQRRIIEAEEILKTI